MILERKKNEILIRLPSNIDLSELQDMLDYLNYKELSAESKANEDKVETIIKDVNSSMWEKVKKQRGI